MLYQCPITLPDHTNPSELVHHLTPTSTTKPEEQGPFCCDVACCHVIMESAGVYVVLSKHDSVSGSI